MKPPEEYVDAQCAGPERPALVTHAQATAAVHQALADAERYKNNLVHALRGFAGPAVQQYLDEVAPDSGAVQVGGDVLPWRVASPGEAARLTRKGLPPDEDPPF